MKIDNSIRTSPLGGTSSTASTSTRSAKTTSETGKSSSQDSVSLSGLSTQIQALESSIAEAPSFDSAKVESIKQAIRDGKFTVNPEVIADKLISSTRELIAQQKR